MNTTNSSKTKRIFYLDALRALAIISVIIIHVASGTQGSYSLGAEHFHSAAWYINTFFKVCFRIGVDLFLVLAGALSLGRQWDIKGFLSKRIPRIVLPFLFWGFVCGTVFLILIYFFPSWFIPQDFTFSFNILNYLNFIYQYYMAQSYTSYAYWFFWMILGTYLIMPIFNKWIYHSKLEELEYFLFFWLITCLFSFTLGMEFPIQLTYFVSPIGLVVLGYYLRFSERKILNNPYFALFLIIASIICEFGISYFLSTPENIYIFDRYSILSAVEVIGIVCLFKNFNKLNIHNNFLDNPNGMFRRTISSLARCSYGMYLIQALVIFIIFKIVRHVPFINAHSSFAIMFILFVSLILSWQTINLLSRIPKISNIVGAK